MTVDAVGGVWQYATGLAAGLAVQGDEVLLAVLGPAPTVEQSLAIRQSRGVDLLDTGLPLDWLSHRGAVREAGEALATIARRERVDLVHLNSPALAAERPFAVPVVAVAHGCLATWWQAARVGPLAAEFRWHHEAMDRGLRAADLVIAPSASFAETLRRHYALPTVPAVVHNGRDVAMPPAGEFRQEVLTVGRLWDEVKNARVLDEVAARLACPFAAAGAASGPHGEAVALHHLEPLGHLDDAALAARLARSPVFVSAATFEPFGLAVLEAASAGCALVLSDITTFRELWDGAAIFVPPNDPAVIAAAVERVLADPQERQRLGAAASERASHYSIPRMAAAMTAHYRALLGRRAAA